MKNDDYIKYLSIAGSICSILGLAIAMSVKMDWVQGVSIVVASVICISLFAFLLWAIITGYNYLLNKEWWPSVIFLKLLVYLCLGLVALIFATSLSVFIYGVINFILGSFVELIKNGGTVI